MTDLAEKYSDLLLVKFVLELLGKERCNELLDMLERGDDIATVRGFLTASTTDFELKFAKYVEVELNGVRY
jgi:hypothetical protein